MTVQEAIKSGKKFRRPGISGWYSSGMLTMVNTRASILATDWEVLLCEKHQTIVELLFPDAQGNLHCSDCDTGAAAITGNSVKCDCGKLEETSHNPLCAKALTKAPGELIKCISYNKL